MLTVKVIVVIKTTKINIVNMNVEIITSIRRIQAVLGAIIERHYDSKLFSVREVKL